MQSAGRTSWPCLVGGGGRERQRRNRLVRHWTRSHLEGLQTDGAGDAAGSALDPILPAAVAELEHARRAGGEPDAVDQVEVGRQGGGGVEAGSVEERADGRVRIGLGHEVCSLLVQGAARWRGCAPTYGWSAGADASPSQVRQQPAPATALGRLDGITSAPVGWRALLRARRRRSVSPDRRTAGRVKIQSRRSRSRSDVLTREAGRRYLPTIDRASWRGSAKLA